jgi:hypothetical protein
VRRYTREQTYTDGLKKMFRMVGEKYPNPKLTDQDGWYQMRCWTEKDYGGFIKWMRKLLRKRHGGTARSADCEARMFALMWGWTTSKEAMEKRLAGATVISGATDEP